MQSLRQKLPPTKALVVFEATARHMSFTRAAEELHLTQAAVSRQIQILEHNLGVPLFKREGRSVKLTAEGERLQRVTIVALEDIAEVSVALRHIHQDRSINIHTTTAFGALWLMQRIGSFRSQYPEIQLRLVSSDEPVDLSEGDIDLAIAYGHGNWSGAESEKLFEDEIYPVCSPAFAAGLSENFSLHDLMAQPLLHLESVEPTWVTWSAWLRGNRVDPGQSLNGTSFNNYLVILQAAQQGQGIALGWHRLVHPFVTAGQLVRPIPNSFQPEGAYYLLVKPGDIDQQSEIQAVYDWLRSQTNEN